MWMNPTPALGALACCAAMQLAAQQGRPIALDDYPKLRGVESISVRPGGDRVVISGGDSLWLMRTQPGSTPTAAGRGIVPKWSPRGNHFAFLSWQGGGLQLWVADERAGHPRQLTHIKGGIDPDVKAIFGAVYIDPFEYAWSPDGRSLVFASRLASRTVRNDPTARSDSTIGGTKPLVLTDSAPPALALVGIFRHGVDGQAYVRGHYESGAGVGSGDDAVYRPNHLFIVDVATGHIRQLTADTLGYFNPAWSPDGRHIVCVSTEGEPPSTWGTKVTSLYLIDVTSGVRRRLVGGAKLRYMPSWSPSGRFVAYLGGSHLAMQHVNVMPAAGGQEKVVTQALDRYVMAYRWGAADSVIVASVHDGVTWPLLVTDPSTGKVRRLTRTDAVVSQFDVAKSGAVVWAQSSEHEQSVVYASHIGSDTSWVVADLNPQIHALTVGRHEVVRWLSAGDTLDGVLIRPVGYRPGRRYPLLVDPYSGIPNTFAMGGAIGGALTLSAAQYMVFVPNHRAPHRWIGYVRGEAYNQKGKGPQGLELSVQDILSGIDTLAGRGLVDTSRMCLIGFSNGGASVQSLITRTSRFRCAVTAAAVVADWPLTVRLGGPEAEAWSTAIVGKRLADDPESYVALSPVYHVAAIRTPLLMAIGDRDEVNVVLGNIEMYQGLRAMGRAVTLVRYPDQGHEFQGRALRDYRERVDQFLAKYLERPDQ
jgi:dipeptidyl aminopeptidase/acylaminoacyl peptidase